MAVHRRNTVPSHTQNDEKTNFKISNMASSLLVPSGCPEDETSLTRTIFRASCQLRLGFSDLDHLGLQDQWTPIILVPITQDDRNIPRKRLEGHEEFADCHQVRSGLKIQWLTTASCFRRHFACHEWRVPFRRG